MQIFKRSAGSATVEASLVFPLVILVIITLLMTGVKMLEKVMCNAALNKAYAIETLEPAMPAETVLRLKWLGIRIVEETADGD